MNHLNRRDLLRIGTLAATGLAGCLTDRPADGPDGTVTTTPTTPTTTSPATGQVKRVEVVQLGADTGQPSWDEDDAAGHAGLYGSETLARAALEFDSVTEDSRDDVDRLLSETEFDRSRLLLLGSVGPDTCYSEIDVGDLHTEGDRLEGAFAAHDPCGDCACGDAVTYPSALVRVTFDGGPVDEARLTATDGWGEEAALEVVSDGGLAPEDLPGYVRPDDDPDPVAPLDCPDEAFTRHGTGFRDDVDWGQATDDGTPTMALRVDQVGYARGSTVTVTMTNVGDEEQYTGNRHKYSLQVYTEDGWQDVRGWDGDPRGYTDEAIVHQPGEGFEWSLTLTEAGVLMDHAHEESLTVCPGLPAGRYRFAFWEPAVAVAFDLLE
jgi:hypothetical protein